MGHEECQFWPGYLSHQERDYGRLIINVTHEDFRISGSRSANTTELEISYCVVPAAGSNWRDQRRAGPGRTLAVPNLGGTLKALAKRSTHWRSRHRLGASISVASIPQRLPYSWAGPVLKIDSSPAYNLEGVTTSRRAG